MGKTSQMMADLWQYLTDEQRRLLDGSSIVEKYKKNDIIYHENDVPRFLYCLVKGKVKIYKEGVGGRQQIVRMPRLKGFFGYRAGFTNSVYSTEASALEDTTLCLIPLDIIKHIILENHQVSFFFHPPVSQSSGCCRRKHCESDAEAPSRPIVRGPAPTEKRLRHRGRRQDAGHQHQP